MLLWFIRLGVIQKYNRNVLSSKASRGMGSLWLTWSTEINNNNVSWTWAQQYAKTFLIKMTAWKFYLEQREILMYMCISLIYLKLHIVHCVRRVFNDTCRPHNNALGHNGNKWTLAKCRFKDKYIFPKQKLCPHHGNNQILMVFHCGMIYSQYTKTFVCWKISLLNWIVFRLLSLQYDLHETSRIS